MMRFIKTADGVYLSVTQIYCLYLYAYEAQSVAILADTDKESEMRLCDNFPDKDAAQRYLRRIVAALTDPEKKVIEVKNYEAD